ncbi:MAG TPA: SpoIIE family protein phosphatase [Bryobacteraceae bacterium]|jgi:anti-sigma regulatory factor (Ser/Thr protein kinase)|nr:SpoIIE family protein phosphatase [Bryobacteraceae bacterium]
MEGIAVIRVVDATQPAEARRMAFRMADEIGFTEAARGKLGIVVTEAATNLLKHAGGGEIILRCPGPQGLEVLAVDAGPGMRSVNECLRDGYSTAGSAGTGLGAICRLSAHSDIYSVEGKGTVVQAFCGSGVATAPMSELWDVASVMAPLKGETVSGDAVAMRETGPMIHLMVVDGLGHGPLAADAAQAARRAFSATEGSPRQIVDEIHARLRSTRGAAVAVAEIDSERGRVRYCGIGNIAGLIATGENTQHMVSMSGIAGHQAVRMREFEYRWARPSIVVMHSDGVSSRWQFSTYAGLAGKRASMVGAVLFRDWRKMNDDATILVGRQK